MTKTNTVTLAIAALALAAPAFGQEVTVYENSSGFANLMTQEGNREVGDEITISNPALNYIDRFEFEYNYVRNGGDGEATAQIRFYALEEVAVPGGGTAFRPEADAFAVSPAFTLATGLGRRIWSGSGGTEGDRPPLGITVPTTFVWTVTFGGLEGGEEAGLLYYGDPEIGTSANDYWARDAVFADWHLYDTPGFVDNFGAKVVAVPEPTALALLGGAALVMGLRRRKA
jgi:hypothetical protein